MKKRIGILFAVFAVVALATMVSAEPTYIGAAKCKMCHKVEYASWSEGPHAKAFDVLSDEEKGKAECLTCHATGNSVDMPGVQCESCHGAGSDYKSMKVMKDSDAAKAAGLIKPDEATCRGCHEGAPHDQKPFDYAEASKVGKHEVKAKAE